MLPALIVGGLTAWYLGLRPGVIAAIVTAVVLLVAAFVPGMSITVYALVIAYAAGLYFLGPKLSKNGGAKSSMLGGALGGAYGQASAWVRKMWGEKQ